VGQQRAGQDERSPRERLVDRVQMNPVARFVYRAKVLLFEERESVRKRPRDSLRFLFRSREVASYSYELANVDELAVVVAEALQVDRAVVERYVRELREDAALYRTLAAGLRRHPGRDTPKYGYRIGPYCIARIAKPSRVFELGTYDGTQAVMLLRALARNEEEGAPGTLFTFDVGPKAGWLLDEARTDGLRFVSGDVGETLEPLLREHGVDLLIQDIGYAWDGAGPAYEAALRNAGERGLVIFAEVNGKTALSELCAREGGRYSRFEERVLDHFWRGNARAIAVFDSRGAGSSAGG
jgi:Methyltransferase domain